MFFTLILENANGDQGDMTATANRYMTSRVEGLNPPPGTISTSSYAGMHGSYLNNAFIEKWTALLLARSSTTTTAGRSTRRTIRRSHCRGWKFIGRHGMP